MTPAYLLGKITQRPPRPTTARARLFRSRFAADRFDPWPRATRYENARIFETFSEMRMAGIDVKPTLRFAASDASATGHCRDLCKGDGVPNDDSLCVPVKPTVSNRCFPCIPCRPSSLTGGMVFRWASQSSPRRRRSPVLSPWRSRAAPCPSGEPRRPRRTPRWPPRCR